MVKHEVTLQEVQRWLDGASTSPNDMVRKLKLKEMVAS